MSTVAKMRDGVHVVDTFDVQKVRKDFPVLNQKVHGKPLVYFDNAATTQKPLAVIEAIEHYYRHDNSNIHRGVHTLSDRPTPSYKKTPFAPHPLLNASDPQKITFLPA